MRNSDGEDSNLKLQSLLLLLLQSFRVLRTSPLILNIEFLSL